MPVPVQLRGPRQQYGPTCTPQRNPLGVFASSPRPRRAPHAPHWVTNGVRGRTSTRYVPTNARRGTACYSAPQTRRASSWHCEVQAPVAPGPEPPAPTHRLVWTSCPLPRSRTPGPGADKPPVWARVRCPRRGGTKPLRSEGMATTARRNIWMYLNIYASIRLPAA